MVSSVSIFHIVPMRCTHRSTQLAKGECAARLVVAQLRRTRERKKKLIRGEHLAQVSPTARWERYAHGADIGVRGRGPTVEEAFEQAAVALVGVITDPSLVELKEEVIIQCKLRVRRSCWLTG